MSEYLTGEEQALHKRIVDFVSDHTTNGLLWLTMDNKSNIQPVLPVQRIEFERHDMQWLSDDMVEGLVGYDDGSRFYAMDVYFDVPSEESQKDNDGVIEPGLISLVMSGSDMVEIEDEYGRLAAIEDGAYNGESVDGLIKAINSLLDNLQELERNGHLVLAGRRTYSLEP